MNEVRLAGGNTGGASLVDEALDRARRELEEDRAALAGTGGRPAGRRA